MEYIEILGPPGAGKTTIHQQILKRNKNLYGGISDGAKYRFMNDKLTSTSIIFQAVPDIYPSLVKNMFRHLYNEDLFIKFLLENKDYADVFSYINDQVVIEKQDRLGTAYRKAVKYEMGKHTCRANERLCVDQGFIQLAVGIGYRSKNPKSTIEMILKCVPMPETVILIDSPSELCLERQRDRGRVALKSSSTNDEYSAQKKYRDITLNTLKSLSGSLDTYSVENTKTVKNAVKSIETELFK